MATKSCLLGHPFRLALGVFQGVCLGHLILDRGYSFGPTQGPSMLPLFEVTGDWALISKRHRYGRDVSVGDLVSYKIPISPVGADGIKRVIGMPGDYVLLNSPDSGSDATIQVPQGHCWLVGDNLPASRDSRHLGPIPLALVKGKVIGKTSDGSWDFESTKNNLRPYDSTSDS